MPQLPTKQDAFQILNQTKHLSSPDTQGNLFEPVPQITSATPAEYWHYTDLFRLYGDRYFPIVPDMTVHVWRQLIMPTQKIKPNGHRMPKMGPTDPTFFYEHVVDKTQPYTIGKRRTHTPDDLSLSRYACWCMSRNNPDLIFARTYFISPSIKPNMSLHELKSNTYQFARVDLRSQLAYYENILSGILKQHGGDFQKFNSDMTRAFFYGYSTNDIKTNYRIPLNSNDPLANYMGSASLNARIIALRNTINRFNRMSKPTRDGLYNILYDELVKQRVYVLNNFGFAPEQDISTTPVSTVKSNLTQTERDFIYEYSQTKLR